MQKITPFLWFNNEAEEAAKFYVAIFKNSKIISTSYYGDNMPLPKGTVLVVDFELNGQRFNALNGGPIFTFTPAISFMVSCENQSEIDDLWNKLSADPTSEQCGWLKDKYGVSWQIVPRMMDSLMNDPDKTKVSRMVATMMTMKKLDIEKLQKAFDGKA
jgi:predicted 3-demethylubiquinone-9 3-methyltransferase (glyoxalase superfamily)